MTISPDAFVHYAVMQLTRAKTFHDITDKLLTAEENRQEAEKKERLERSKAPFSFRTKETSPKARSKENDRPEGAVVFRVDFQLFRQFTSATNLAEEKDAQLEDLVPVVDLLPQWAQTIKELTEANKSVLWNKTLFDHITALSMGTENVRVALVSKLIELKALPVT